MAEFRVPFVTTEELPAPFRLDEDFANGRKRVLLSADNLQVMVRRDTITSEIGDIVAMVFHVVGTIEYLCNVFPIVASDSELYTLHRFVADFDDTEGNSAGDCVDTVEDPPARGWLSSVGCLPVDIEIGASTCFNTCNVEIPTIVSVEVDDLAVDNNLTAELDPVCGDCDEEPKRVIKWRGCFVITTSN